MDLHQTTQRLVASIVRSEEAVHRGPRVHEAPRHPASPRSRSSPEWTCALAMCLNGALSIGVCWGRGVSGLATAAVGTIAIYLAHPYRPLSLKVNVFPARGVNSEGETRDTSYWRIGITNCGRHAVTIVERDWWVGRARVSFKVRLTSPDSPKTVQRIHIHPGQTRFLQFHFEQLFHETWHLTEKQSATLRLRLHTSDRTRKFHPGNELLYAIKTTPSARKALREMLEPELSDPENSN